jgi:hypothetical protein
MVQALFSNSKKSNHTTFDEEGSLCYHLARVVVRMTTQYYSGYLGSEEI